MKSAMKTTLATTLAVGTALTALSAVDAPATAKELKLAHFMSPAHPMHRVAFAPLAKAMNEASGGALTIKIFPAGQLGKGPVAQYKRAIDGVTDMSFVVTQYVSKAFPKSMLLTLPGVGNTAQEITEKAYSVYDKHLASEYKNIKMLALWALDPSNLLTKKPISTVADIKGLKIRPNSPAASRIVKAWGAAPVGMPVSKVYNNFNTGVVNAVMIGASALYKPWNLNEPAEYVVDNFPGYGSMFFLAMNKKSWDGLTKDEKALVDQHTGKKFGLVAAGGFNRDTVNGIAAAKAGKGVKYIRLTTEQRATFEKAVKPAVESTIAQLEKQGHKDARAMWNAISK